jgi:hypothetical protein
MDINLRTLSNTYVNISYIGFGLFQRTEHMENNKKKAN